MSRPSIADQLAPVRAIQACPPPHVHEVRITKCGDGDTIAYIFGTHRGPGERRRYLCFSASEDDDQEADEIGKLAYFRSGEDRSRLVDSSDVTGLVGTNAEWLAGGAES
jgi:hypothetical protein